MSQAIPVKWLPRPSPYVPVWGEMRGFTESRDTHSPDEIWLVEHMPVYTLGQAGKPEHVLDPGGIDVVRTDRGGQVTYHGPGQVVAYCMVDLRRHGLFVKEYVALLEDVLIDFLDTVGATGACRKSGAPGVYVPGKRGELAKIAALGIKVRNGCTYHGLALNVDMDLAPFLRINPCGYEGLETIDLRSCGVEMTLEEAGWQLGERLAQAFEACMPHIHT
ncbi:lipoyl(octanoyl) transferase LipB [Allopusillimonas ginsengisoli]|uniref:lipoyl(octanoyl) transferase LipB n=1 Tax=Allopusillimonas ginsengisoli TaxID=453575 RepID=UPI00101F9E33|nr:lipoyl(octanoyl) transferase LipB [Allopusillimonas ginsengisoli]TEA77848.1 lipoyl(octanoyl) transferase LipB [Allopusillimonas ginsengisoli]